MSSIIPSYFKDMSEETQGQDYQEILSSPDTTDTTDTTGDPKGDPKEEATDENKSEDLPEPQEQVKNLVEEKEPKMKSEKSMKTKKTEKSEKSEMSEMSERPEKKKRPPRPRKDVLCEICGKTYSSLTKSHKCCPPKGFVRADQVSQAESPSVIPPVSDPLPPKTPETPEITLEDVRGFLAKAQEEKRASRRSTWISQLF